jgi:hypothetical protein
MEGLEGLEGLRVFRETGTTLYMMRARGFLVRGFLIRLQTLAAAHYETSSILSGDKSCILFVIKNISVDVSFVYIRKTRRFTASLRKKGVKASREFQPLAYMPKNVKCTP